MRFRFQLATLLVLLPLACRPAGKIDEYAAKVAPLIDSTKLFTLGERGVNPRIQKATYWLAAAKLNHTKPDKVALEAVLRAGYTGESAKLTADALVRNLTIVERLGCVNEIGLSKMRRGAAPTITRGPYAGDTLSVDHIIPLSVCRELDKVVANLELMPLGMNVQKSDKIGQRQRDLAAKFYKAGLLSKEGYKQVAAFR